MKQVYFGYFDQKRYILDKFRFKIEEIAQQDLQCR